MEYCTLGRSGLRLSRLCLGAMTFGAGTGIWGGIAGLDRARATRLVALAVEHGINLNAQKIALTANQTERLNQVSKPPLPYPYWVQQAHDKDRIVV